MEYNEGEKTHYVPPDSCNVSTKAAVTWPTALDKICHLRKLQTVRQSRFYGAEKWGFVEGWEVIDRLEGRIGKKVLKINLLRIESLNWIWVVTVRQGNYYVWKWSVASSLGIWATSTLHMLLWLAGTEYQNWRTLYIIHKVAFQRLVHLSNTCHLLIHVKSWERCACPFPTCLLVYVTQVERIDGISLRYDTIFIYCNWVSIQWQWSLHCTQNAKSVIYVRRNKANDRTHKMESKRYKQ